jgi:hypothetical protein
MEKKLTANEAMELTNQLIDKEMIRSGRTYKEVSQEFRHKLQEKMEQKNNYQMTKYLSKAHQEVTEAKMKSIEEWRKHPLTQEEMDKIVQEHFDAHRQINPNKKVNSEITTIDEAQTQKMQEYNQRESLAVAEMMKLPMSSEEKDRMIQEHFEDNNQVNPNKRNS